MSAAGSSLLQAGFELAQAPFRAAAYMARRSQHRRSVSDAIWEAAFGPGERPTPRGTDVGSADGHGTTLLISCGDPSGEAHAIRLVEAVGRLRPGVRWVGIGGPLLETAGVEIAADLVSRGIMGFSQPLKEAGHALEAMHAFERLLDEARPAAVVLLDYPGWHMFAARVAKQRGIPVIDYVAPQVWAWAPWRVSRLAARTDRVLSILPFEELWFARHGVTATWVGHPLADALADLPVRADGAAQDADLLAILPGSRLQEVKRNLPIQLRAAAMLMDLAGRPLRVTVCAPTARHAEAAAAIAGDATVPIEVAVGSLHDTLARARLAFVKSGTAVLDVAHHQLPSVVFYRLSGALTDAARRWLLSVPHVASINLIAGRRLVPEFVRPGEDWAAEAALAALPLLEDTDARRRTVAGLASANAAWETPGTAERAASWVVSTAEAKGRRAAEARS